MNRILPILLLAASLAGCQVETKGQVANEASPAPEAPSPPPAPDPETIRPGDPGGLPDDRRPVEEGPIDPKSAQGAGQVLQRYGGLLEQRKFAEAYRLWRNPAMTEAQFVTAFDKYSEIHSEVGRPGDSEGAAGSIYVDIPFRLYGKLKTGEPFNMVGPVTLRRVNDVPGSTEEQRRWHISASGLKPRP
jgi:hypothetical protein